MSPSQCALAPVETEQLRTLSPVHYNQANQANEEAV